MLTAMAPPIAALAQGDTANLPKATPHWAPASGYGLAIMAGGGATDFTNAVTRGETSTGGSWTVRFAVATRSLIGFEASYVGGANAISGLGAGNATLVRNGVEGVLRINAPLHARNVLLEPYLFGGAGWNGYRVTSVNSAATASVTTGTNSTLSVPLGFGFSVGYQGFVADLRYTIRPTYEQSIFRGQASTALTNWDAGAMLGYEF
jgi:hypothetical protein